MDPLEELLTNAMHEIQDLRRRNEILSAKVEDVAWALHKKITEIKEKMKPRVPPSQVTL